MKTTGRRYLTFHLQNSRKPDKVTVITAAFVLPAHVVDFTCHLLLLLAPTILPLLMRYMSSVRETTGNGNARQRPCDTIFTAIRFSFNIIICLRGFAFYSRQSDRATTKHTPAPYYYYYRYCCCALRTNFLDLQ